MCVCVCVLGRENLGPLHAKATPEPRILSTSFVIDHVILPQKEDIYNIGNFRCAPLIYPLSASIELCLTRFEWIEKNIRELRTENTEKDEQIDALAAYYTRVNTFLYIFPTYRVNNAKLRVNKIVWGRVCSRVDWVFLRIFRGVMFGLTWGRNSLIQVTSGGFHTGATIPSIEKTILEVCITTRVLHTRGLSVS